MTPETLLPLLLVGAGFCLVPRSWLKRRPGQLVTAAAVGLMVARYLHWRVTDTVAPADLASIGGVFVHLVFAVELLAWIDAAIIFALLCNRSDRSPEADWHEDRLRDTAAESLPRVDVFIATYNEPIEVLEKTLSGALALDWPAERLDVWILDDGRRDWLARYAARRGARYLTREGNEGAKAGNINAAIRQTSAPFFLVLDADFVPQRRFLYRTMGFFDDPRVGIVQTPHNFFNADPKQTSLAMAKIMPDDQRFFFDAIMPGRDGYDCAFCCGSNGIVRRAALEDIGGRLPTGSITEDQLLTLALKRRGYVTRYLDEPLAYGLAPESINAFFIQRARWAQGAMQIAYLPEGPLRNRGLALHERLFFLPLHWISQTLTPTLSMVVPAIFLLTGMPPLVGAEVREIVSLQVPAILAAMLGVRLLAPREYHVVMATADSVLQAFRLLPVVFGTLLKPHGHSFRVTPKGGGGVAVHDRATVLICLAITAITALGLYLNAGHDGAVIRQAEVLPVVTFWAVVNGALLMLVAKIAMSPPARRKEERFDLEEEMRLHLADGTRRRARSRDVSVTGALVELTDAPPALASADWVCLEIAGVGLVPARVRRRLRRGPRAAVGVAFVLPVFDDLALSAQRLGREANRQAVDGAVRLHLDAGTRGGRLCNVSSTGALITLEESASDLSADMCGLLEIEGGIRVPAEIRRVEHGAEPGASRIALRFAILDAGLRERLIEKLFTDIRASGVTNDRGWRIFRRLVAGLFASDGEAAPAPPQPERASDVIVPDWIRDLIAADRARQSPDTTATGARVKRSPAA